MKGCGAGRSERRMLGGRGGEGEGGVVVLVRRGKDDAGATLALGCHSGGAQT